MLLWLYAESDSANLDHMAELMVRSGGDPQEALMALVPEAYRNHPDLVKNYPEVSVLHFKRLLAENRVGGMWCVV